MMLSCFTASAKNARIIQCITAENQAQIFQQLSTAAQTWLNHCHFKLASMQVYIVPNAQGQIEQVLFAPSALEDAWSWAKLATDLPPGDYQLSPDIEHALADKITLVWGMQAYDYRVYKTGDAKPTPQLYVDKARHAETLAILDSIYWARDLINMPANDMHPARLAQAATDLAATYQADISIITGDDLLQKNYPAIHAVGKASTIAPRLIDLSWGDADKPQVCLIGKGVCFDTGGLDLKTASGMILMKKDMGGAAHVLGLAQLIMAQQLPIRLRVLIPAVDNSVAGNAYRPSDVIRMRNGKTVEIQNTDAEGRLILADALAEASTTKPDLIIDFATLTGSARSAVGPDIAAMFSNNEALAHALMQASNEHDDPIWRLPLHASYERYLRSDIADLQNCSANYYAGAITAALFLQHFVHPDIPWVHFDLMGANVDTRNGHPKGGEALALRAVYAYLKTR